MDQKIKKTRKQRKKEKRKKGEKSPGNWKEAGTLGPTFNVPVT